MLIIQSGDYLERMRMTKDQSEAALKLFPDFAQLVSARLEVGKETYGDASFVMTESRNLSEIQQELLDVCGWAFILWVRLQMQQEKIRTALVPNDEEYTERRCCVNCS